MNHFHLNIRYYVLGILLIVCLLIWYVLLSNGVTRKLEVAFLNIGQGDSIFIESPNGHQMLVDGGPDRSVLSRLSQLMPFYDRTIDVVLATHPDKDHIAGLVDVLSKYRVGVVIMTEATSSTDVFQSLLKAAEKSGATIIHPRRGMIVKFGEGADFRILFPDRSMAGQIDTNLTSIVGRVGYGKEGFLLTGDSPMAVEHYEVSLDREILQSDVLKPGHHGSKTSTSAEFVGVVNPIYAVLSVGKDNLYGHPNQETLATLNQFDVKILRTDEDGTIVFKTDGETLSAPTFKK